MIVHHYTTDDGIHVRSMNSTVGDEWLSEAKLNSFHADVADEIRSVDPLWFDFHRDRRISERTVIAEARRYRRAQYIKHQIQRAYQRIARTFRQLTGGRAHE